MDHVKAKMKSQMNGEDRTHVGMSARSIKMFAQFPTFHTFFKEASGNEYHKDKNPEGIIPFGVAENKLAIDILLPQMKKATRAPVQKRVYSYGKVIGADDFRLSLKKFLEHKFHPLHDLDINTLFVTNGTTSILENLAFALAQPGEYIMVVRPFYYGLYLDFITRPEVRILPVDQPLPSETPSKRFALDVPAIERAYKQAASEGKIVRAVYFTNPSNPTGDVYTAQELKDLLDFAHRYDIHVIANELYGLSVYDPKATVTSILSVPHPDPEKVHFLWGFSKDFGLSGMRISSLYTRSPGVARYFTQCAIYIQPTAQGQRILKHLIDDLDIVDNEFLPEMKQQMQDRHRSIKEAIERYGGHVHPSPATIFRWINLSSFMPTQDWAGEHQLFLRLLNGGVHLVEGSSLEHKVPGWFRMVAALEDHVHEEGMTRLIEVLKNIRSEKEQQQQQQQLKRQEQ